MNGAVADPAFIPSSPAFEEVAGDSARLTLLAEVRAAWEATAAVA